MIEESATRSVVLLWGKRSTAGGGKEPGTIGTAFVVGAMEGDEQFLYVVTCAHNLSSQPNDGNDVELMFRTDSGHLLRGHNTGRWQYPDDEKLDFAVAPLQTIIVPKGGDLPAGTEVSLPAISLSDDLVVGSAREEDLKLGLPVLYVGLLEPLDAMALLGVPMVRSGTIGRLCQPQLSMSVGGNYYEYTGHLIDCRSYMGFSGSPVFAEFHYLSVVDDSLIEVNDIKLWGMFTGHLRDRKADVDDLVGTFGVGMVLPIEIIKAFIETNEFLRTDRVNRHAVTLAARDEPAFVGDSAAEVALDDGPYSEANFLTDLRRVSRPVERPDQ